MLDGAVERKVPHNEMITVTVSVIIGFILNFGFRSVWWWRSSEPSIVNRIFRGKEAFQKKYPEKQAFIRWFLLMRASGFFSFILAISFYPLLPKNITANVFYLFFIVNFL